MTKLLACVILLTALPVYAAELGCVGDCANGTGTYYFSGGGRYEGEWKDGAQTGQGTYYFANGDRYEGELKDGIRYGQGTYYYSNGNRYEGEWKDGKRDGHGTYYFADGDHFKGEWVDGERTKVEVCVLSVCFAVVPWIYDVIDFAVVAAPWAAIVVAAILIFYGIRRRYESKRSEALRSIAFTLGMSFEDGRDIDATQRFGPFHLFSRWSGGKVRNCLSGTIDGVNVTTFGYEYTVDAGESSTTPQQTVVFFHSNELSLPDFELRARRFFDLVDYFRGAGKDIHIESRPDFSKSYYLRGKDESAIRHVFSRSVLEYFESHKGLSLEGRDERLLCYRTESHITDMGLRGARVRPDELKLFIDEGRAVFDLFRMKS